MFPTHKILLFIFSLLLLSACNRSTDPTADSATPVPTEAEVAVVAPTDTPVPSLTSEEVATEGDAAPVDDVTGNKTDEVADVPYTGRPPEELWTGLACSACHQIDKDQTEADPGPVGPHQGNLAERIAIIAPDQTPEEYVYTSIVDPNAFVVKPYLANIMPQNYSEQMSEAEIRQLVQWLLEPNR